MCHFFLIIIFYRDTKLLSPMKLPLWRLSLGLFPEPLPVFYPPFCLKSTHFRLPLLWSLKNPLIPSLCVLFSPSSVPGIVHLTEHKPSCHWCLNCRWLLNASCVWKSSNVISIISPLLAVQHSLESIAKITKQLSKVNSALNCGRILT